MEVEVPVLTGYLNIPAQTGFSLNRISKKKSATHKHCLLFKASRHGIERLEISDREDNKNPKIITLENCVKITQEPAPANLIHVVTRTGTLTLNPLSEDDLKQWLSALQNVAFRDKSGTLARHSVIEEDNDLYCTSYGDGIFTIRLVPSDVCTKCNLETKSYLLQLTATDMLLKNASDDVNFIVCKWPYRYIRKYGYRDGKFTFEAGRKCDTGEGVFSLEHSNPQEIFRCLAAKMKSMKKLISGDNMASIDCGDHQLNAALSMEAGSRSPLPPSPNHHTLSSECDLTQSGHLLRGFLSSNDSLNNVSTSSSSIPLIKHIPNKPPRKSLPERPDNIDRLLSSNSQKYNKFQNYDLVIPPPTQSSVAASSSSSSVTAATAASSAMSPMSVIPSSSSSSSSPSILFDANIKSGTIVLKSPPASDANKTIVNLISSASDHSQLNVQQPPELPVRNESKNCDDRDYECIETITNAWRTMGIDDVKHTEHVSTPPDDRLLHHTISHHSSSHHHHHNQHHQQQQQQPPPPPPQHHQAVEFHWQRTQSHRDISTDRKPLLSSIKIDLDSAPNSPSMISSSSSGVGVVGVDASKTLSPSAASIDTDYDRLQFFGSNSKPSSDYKTIVTVTPPGYKKQSSQPVTSNDYEIIGNPDIQSCRLADDSYMGYGVLRKPQSQPPNLMQQSSSSAVGHDDDLLDHRKFNGLDYAVVSKPKRV